MAHTSSLPDAQRARPGPAARWRWVATGPLITSERSWWVIPAGYAAFTTLWIVAWNVWGRRGAPIARVELAVTALFLVLTTLVVGVMAALWKRRLVELLDGASALEVGLAHAADPVVVLEESGATVFANRAFADAFGYRPSPERAFWRTDHGTLRNAPTWQVVRQAVDLTGSWAGEIELGRDSESRRARVAVHRVAGSDATPTMYTLLFGDAYDGAQHATFDDLTLLPTRAAFRHHCAEALADGQPHTLLIADVDRLGDVNQSLGSSAGDAALCEVARRLSLAFGHARLVGRVGDDEFAVLLPGHGVTRDALDDVMRVPWSVGDVSIQLAVTVGKARYPDDGATMARVYGNAELALTHARSRGSGGWLRYAENMRRSTAEEIALVRELGDAIDNGDLTVHLQSQHDARTGRIRGFEALARWQHPERGWISPGVFVPVAERYGLLRAMTERVVDVALGAVAGHAGRHDGSLRISVNLAATSLEDESLVGFVAERLQAHGVPAICLELEITETSMMSDVTTAIERVKEFKALGASIAVDDFGTGYSSLMYLARFPLDRLKLDMSFVRGLPGDHASRVLSRTVIAMARQLGLRVVAEGVETEAQLAFLREAGADEVQGYLLGRPMSIRDALEALDAELTATRTLAAAPRTSSAELRPAAH